MMKVRSGLHSVKLQPPRFVFSQRLDSTQMGYGNSLFESASGAMYQGYYSVKLRSVHTSGDQYLSLHLHMYDALRLFC